MADTTTIFGLEPEEPFPDAWVPIEGVAAVRCFDADGDSTLLIASSSGLSLWEQVGMLTGALDVARASLTDSFVQDSDDEEVDDDD